MEQVGAYCGVVYVFFRLLALLAETLLQRHDYALALTPFFVHFSEMQPSDLKCLPRILLSDMSPNLDRFVAITCEWPQLQNRGLTHMNTYYIRVTDIVGSSVTGYETRYFPAIHHHLRPCLVQYVV